ncbi:MAG: hypothetical protein D3926_22850 [Desulfobacteraceae bacterium]|nr:MAG: hypothetical protein D3926_22850 [Desulfobacteraceae bacterium]
MYYIYFPFVLILSGLMVLECHLKKQPKWYAVAVFLAPVTTPYFIFKIRKDAGVILLMIFMTVFSAVCAGEVILYSIQKDRVKLGKLTPFTRELVMLTNAIKKNTIRLDNGLIKLEALSKVESRRPKIKETIDFIAYLRKLMTENQTSIQAMTDYARSRKGYFQKKNILWVFQIEQFYSNYNVTQHQKSLVAYLDAFEELLKYTYVNFYAIDDAKDPKHLKNYDEYYFRYRRAVDAHNRFNVKRIEFQNSFLDTYPELMPYLPGKSQPEAFRLWG